MTTVIAAVLAGGATGIGLHAWRPDPLATALGTDNQPSTQPSDDGEPSASPPPSRSASPSPSPSASPSPSPSASKTSKPSPSTSTTPSFTKLALFRTTDFTAHGWAVARVTNSYSRLPEPPITPCTTISMGDTGIRTGYAGSWSSDHTEAVELVARYVDEAAAKKAFSQALNMIANCDSTAYDPKVLVVGAARTATADRVDDIRWFNTQASSHNDTRGVIGVVRSDDRIALVEMSSSDTDPDNTHQGGSTDIAAILGIAGQRLI